MYNDFYDEDFLLEKKDDDNDDDGLLSHGIRKKKENPLYTDYKNQQIMSGKVVKSEKGWQKEEKRKERLKKLAGLGLAAAGGIAVSRKLESPEKKAQRQQNKIDAERNKTYFKQSKSCIWC